MKVKFKVDVWDYLVEFWDDHDEAEKCTGLDLPYMCAFSNKSKCTVGAVVDIKDRKGIYDHRFLQALSHECNHMAMDILHFQGVNFDGNNHQEVLCYTQDLLFRKILDKMSKNYG